MRETATPEQLAMAAVWRNAVTNTLIIIDTIRKRHERSLHRSKSYAAFDDDLEAALSVWFEITRKSTPANYQEAEDAFKAAMEQISV